MLSSSDKAKEKIVTNHDFQLKISNSGIKNPKEIQVRSTVKIWNKYVSMMMKTKWWLVKEKNI